MAKAANKTSAPPLIGAVAKRKKRKPQVAKKMSSPRKRRKIKGIGDELPKVMEMILAASGGAFVGRIITNLGFLQPNANSTDYGPYGAVVAGVATMLLIKNPIAKTAGLGCAAQGVMGLVPDKDIPQIGAVRMIGAARKQAPPQIIRIGNKSKPRLIAGNTTPAMVGRANYNRGKMMGGMGG